MARATRFYVIHFTSTNGFDCSCTFIRSQKLKSHIVPTARVLVTKFKMKNELKILKADFQKQRRIQTGTTLEKKS